MGKLENAGFLTPAHKALLTRAASRGAALLDERRPGWARRIARLHRSALKLDDGAACILGHLFASAAKAEWERTPEWQRWCRFKRNGFEMGEERLKIEGRTDRYGFTVPKGWNNHRLVNEAYSYLEEAWVRQLVRRHPRSTIAKTERECVAA
jgi:hypothetical protein